MATVIPAAPVKAFPVVIAGLTGPTGPTNFDGAGPPGPIGPTGPQGRPERRARLGLMARLPQTRRSTANAMAAPMVPGCRWRRMSSMTPPLTAICMVARMRAGWRCRQRAPVPLERPAHKVRKVIPASPAVPACRGVLERRVRKVRLAAVGLSAPPGPLELKDPQVHRAPPEARGLLDLLDPPELPAASGRPEPLARQEQDRRRMPCR